MRQKRSEWNVLLAARVASSVNGLEHAQGGADEGRRKVGGFGKGLHKCRVILRQIAAKGIGLKENPHAGRKQALLADTPGSATLVSRFHDQ